MAPITDALRRMLTHHVPYPAVVVDREFNLIMDNKPFQLLLSLFGDPKTLWEACCPRGTANLLRQTFHPHGARPLIKNFDEVDALLLQRAWRETISQWGLYP